MKCAPFVLTLLAGTVLGILPASAASPVVLKSQSVQLPDDSAHMFTGQGADAINNNCLACHSTEMVLNQPDLPRATWEAEVKKMIGVYKAPVDDKDIAAILEYLMSIKGAK